ncbi:MAG: VOC family protein [Acidimicrobiales bacterium]
MPTRDTAPLGAPCWIDLMSSDTGAASAFYCGVFGWTAEDPDPDFGGYANFLLDGAPVAGLMPEMPGAGVSNVWSIYLATADAAASTSTAVANGGSVHVEPMTVGEFGMMAVVTDNAGATFGLWQPGTHLGFTTVGEPNAPAWFELATRNYKAAVDFYTTLTGLSGEAMDEGQPMGYTVLRSGDAMVAGIMDAEAVLPEGVPSHWTVYLGSADTDATLARISELGGRTIVGAQDTPYGRMATACDPLGAIFKVVSQPS